MPLIVFFIIGVIVASQKWHESFFWTIVALSIAFFSLSLAYEIKRQMRIVREDKERAKRNGVKYKPEPVEFHMGFLEWFCVISVIGLVIFTLCTGI